MPRLLLVFALLAKLITASFLMEDDVVHEISSYDEHDDVIPSHDEHEISFLNEPINSQLLATDGRDLGTVRDCTQFYVPVCEIQTNRDLVFLLDASESLDRAKFYTIELDVIQSIFCSVNPGFKNRGALATFSNVVTTRIPFALYTAAQWFAKVELIRTNPLACCRCCTPLAEAFQRARVIISNAPAVPYVPLRTVFVVTDGEPYQNPGTTGWLWRKTPQATYMLGTVPSQANALKNQNLANPVRIMLLGVPDANGIPPRADYFAGIPDPALNGGPSFPANRQCYKRGTRTSCGTMNLPPFPLVSLPVSNNSFTWDFAGNVPSQVYSFVDMYCGVFKTRSPSTFTPVTLRPTVSLKPTAVPTLAPSRTPTTARPSVPPTSRAPSASPSEGPCGLYAVPRCSQSVNRDVVFLLDSSDSINRATFYTTVMDMVSTMFCMFRGPRITRAALVTFSNNIITRIPLAVYTPRKWAAEIEILRANEALCCRCCTPLAEAFRRARNIFANATAVPYVPLRNVFVITDGEPYQNTEGAGWLFPNTLYAPYMLRIVPQQASGLRYENVSNPVRLMLLGIPNKDGVPPLMDYFAGIPDPTITGGPTQPPNRQCYFRGTRTSCELMDSPPFPLVTLPFAKNAFSLVMTPSTVQMETLMIVDALCGLPSMAPTRAPSVAPSMAPTSAPSIAPSKVPTSAPSIAPSKIPTSAPI